MNLTSSEADRWFRAFLPVVAACPGCGRTTSTVFQELARRIEDDLRAAMPLWKEKYPGVEALSVAKAIA